MKLFEFQQHLTTSASSTSKLPARGCRGLRVRWARESITVRWGIVAALLPLLLSGPSAKVRAGGLARVEFSAFCEHRPVTVNPVAPSAPLPLRLENIVNADSVIRGLGLNRNARQALERNGFVVVPNGT